MKINSTIKLLIFSEVFYNTGFGLILPILAVFIADNISGGNLTTVGVATTIFLITKAFIQLPFSLQVDQSSRSFSVKWLIIGSFIITLTPLIYLFATHIIHIFIAQFLYGLGSGLTYPTFLGLWSTHLDRNQESFEWSLYSTLVALGNAIAAVLGATLTQSIGFRFTFIVVALMSFISALILFKLTNSAQKNPPLTFMEIITLPQLRQTFSYDCGAKAIQTVLVYYGLEIREDHVIKGVGTNQSGTTITGIIKYAQKHGLKVDSKAMTIIELKKYINRKIPIIIPLQAWPDKPVADWTNHWQDGHYVVVIGYTHRKIIFEDPSSFERTYLSYRELNDRWHDKDYQGKKYYQHGIALYGLKPKFKPLKIKHLD